MKKNVLLLYSTVDGQTFTIISKIAEHLNLEAEHIVYKICNVTQICTIDLSSYNAILVGASIRYGHFNKQFLNFIDNNYQQLNDKCSAFFAVNVLARKAGKDTPQTNTYTRKFLEKTAWKPNLSAVFAGALRYPHYKWYDRWIIRLIMRLGGEKHDMTQEYEYTRWEAVDNFANQFVEKLIHDTI